MTYTQSRVGIVVEWQGDVCIGVSPIERRLRSGSHNSLTRRQRISARGPSLSLAHIYTLVHSTRCSRANTPPLSASSLVSLSLYLYTTAYRIYRTRVLLYITLCICCSISVHIIGKYYVSSAVLQGYVWRMSITATGRWDQHWNYIYTYYTYLLMHRAFSCCGALWWTEIFIRGGPPLSRADTDSGKCLCAFILHSIWSSVVYALLPFSYIYTSFFLWSPVISYIRASLCADTLYIRV